MTFDLQHTLMELAGHGEAGAGEAPTERMAGLIHRRRAVRTGTRAGIGLVAAGALVLGGVQLGGREADPPVGPATVEPTQSPLPFPSPRCLDRAPQWTPAGGVLLWTELEESTVTQPADGTTPAELDVTVNLVSANPEDVVVRPESRLGLVVVQDGQVVGMTTSTDNLPDAVTLGPDEVWSAQMAYPLESCQIPVPLDPGFYLLYATLVVEDASGTTVEMVSDPMGVTISDPDVDPDSDAGRAQLKVDRLEALLALARQNDVGGWACGGTVPAEDPQLLSMDFALDDRQYPAGEWVDTTVTVRAAEGTTVHGSIPRTGAQILLVRDGAIVAASNQVSSNDTQDTLDLSGDQTATVRASGWFHLCGLPGGQYVAMAVPAGTYQAYAILEVQVGPTTILPSGATISDVRMIASNPVEVTVG